MIKNHLSFLNVCTIDGVIMGSWSCIQRTPNIQDIVMRMRAVKMRGGGNQGKGRKQKGMQRKAQVFTLLSDLSLNEQELNDS